MNRIRIWKRGNWHWWCPCCLDGHTVMYWHTAQRQAAAHLHDEH